MMTAKHGLLKDLWNAALEERVSAWRKGHRITRSDQEKALREIRLDVGGWRGLVHTHEAQVVLKRLDLAFQGFFRRLAAGGKPGFPRFKSADRFPGWGYKEHGNGFRIEMREGWRHGHVTLFSTRLVWRDLSPAVDFGIFFSCCSGCVSGDIVIGQQHKVWV